MRVAGYGVAYAYHPLRRDMFAYHFVFGDGAFFLDLMQARLYP